MMSPRRRFLRHAAALFAASQLPACGGSVAPLKIAAQIWPGYEPMRLADSLGWLAGAPVHFTETPSATESLALLNAGSVDGAGLTLDEVLRARELGLALTVIMVCDISAGADAFLVRPEIRVPAELKGKRIGIEEGALGTLMLHEALKRAGLKRSDVVVVPAPLDRHVEAWRAGEIDAVASYEPTAGHVAKLGAQRLFDSRSMPDTIIDVLAVRPQALARAHAETLTQLVAAHLRALRYIDTNPGDAAYRIAPRFKLPPDEALSVFRGMVLADAANNHRLLAGANPALLTSVTRIAEVMQAVGVLRQAPAIEGLIDARYLPPVAE